MELSLPNQLVLPRTLFPYFSRSWGRTRDYWGRRRGGQGPLSSKNSWLQGPFPPILRFSYLNHPGVLHFKKIRFYLIENLFKVEQNIKLLHTLTCSELAWKVWTPMICWKRLRLMMTKPLSNFAAAASWLLISWRKKRSRDRGCL